MTLLYNFSVEFLEVRNCRRCSRTVEEAICFDFRTDIKYTLQNCLSRTCHGLRSANFRFDKRLLLIDRRIYAGPLSSVVLNERSGIRKSLLDIVCSCLACSRLSPADRSALLRINALFLNDKDANVRLRALSAVSKSPQCLTLLTTVSDAFPIIEAMIKHLLDKSKVVRLKALQTIERVLSYLAVPSQKCSDADEDESIGLELLQTQEQIQTALFPVLIRSFTIPQDSQYFCKESLSGAAHLLSVPCKLSVVQPYLESLIAITHSPDSRALTLQILQTHLDSYQAWSSFLCSSSDRALAKLDGFLKDTASPSTSRSDGSRIANLGNASGTISKECGHSEVCPAELRILIGKELL